MLLEERDSIRELVPDQGWLGEFVRFTDGMEACPRFRFFTACCALGAAVNNKVRLQRGDDDLLIPMFPNVWVLILAPPGRGHKTSTINMAVNCLFQACPEVRILADKLTPESLVKSLAAPTEAGKIRIGPEDATGLIKAPELSVFFGKQQYNAGLVSLVTDLYDYREEWASDTIMRGRTVLRRNCISIIGGSTPDWLQTMLPQDAFTGGFMSRFVIAEMPATYFKRRAFPKKLGEKGWMDLVYKLQELSRLNGEMTWTEHSKEYYQNYYEKLKPTGDKQKDAYQERESEQILKLSMVLALAEGKMCLEETHMVLAKKMLDALMEETSPRIERLTTHPRMSLPQDILDILKINPQGLTRQELLKRVYRGLSHGEAQFLEAIRVLSMTGQIDSSGGVNPVLKLASEKGEQHADISIRH